MAGSFVIGICDDEQKYIEIAKEYCEKLAEELKVTFVYHVFNSGEQVIESAENIDILLLDIELNGINGIETMHMLEEAVNIKNILFMSGHSNYVFEAFGTKTKGFVCKPIEYEKYKRELEKVIEIVKKERNHKMIEINVNDTLVMLDARKIRYVKAEGRYVRLVTENAEYLVCENIKVWEDVLREYYIIRVHRSYLANFDKVCSIDNTELILKNGERVPVGRKYYNDVKQIYKTHMFKRMRERGK